MIGPLSYIGGKNRLAAHIISMMPTHQTYVEPFAGGAQVFFHKPRELSKVEVLNDLDGDIVNFFRVCQHHEEELLRCLKYLVVSRQWFDLLQRTPPDTLTDIHRAARFFYLQKNAFAGLVRHRNFAIHVVQRPGFQKESVADQIRQTHDRLSGVQIESLPYEEIMKRFDRAGTMFYLDPPYFARKLYTFNFEDEDFRGLEQHFRVLKGKFLLSLNDVPEVRKIFSRYKIVPVELAYSSQKKAGVRYGEVIVKNY